MDNSEPRACCESEGQGWYRSCKQVERGDHIFTTTLIVFLTLKLAGLVTWSWWWVLAPLWMPTGALIVFAGAVFLVGKLIAGWGGRNTDQ